MRGPWWPRRPSARLTLHTAGVSVVQRETVKDVPQQGSGKSTSGSTVGVEKDAHRGVGIRFQLDILAIFVISRKHGFVHGDPKQHSNKVIGAETPTRRPDPNGGTGDRSARLRRGTPRFP